MGMLGRDVVGWVWGVCLSEVGMWLGNLRGMGWLFEVSMGWGVCVRWVAGEVSAWSEVSVG
jgi:hypothetical protein